MAQALAAGKCLNFWLLLPTIILPRIPMPLPFPVLSATDAAALIQNGQTVSFSGFTPAGAAKAIPQALAARAKLEHEAGRPFQIGVVTGASTGQALDGELALAGAIAWRTPYQSNKHLRAAINAGQTRFFDMHLSTLPQQVRYGFLGKFDWAVIEASDVTADGKIVPTTSVGASPTFCHVAERVLIEWNRFHPTALRGLHDIYEPLDPPNRLPIPLNDCHAKIGTPYIQVDPAKIVAIVETHFPDDVAAFNPSDPTTDQIGNNVADFLAAELRANRIPPGFLPIQSGVGNIANAVLAAVGRHPDIPPFSMFSEVIQDSVVDLIRSGKCIFATGTSLTVSPPVLKEIYENLDFYKPRICLRPQEITNHPELVRRLGIITINTALEVDLSGNVNSTHVMGRDMMNGIGGSGDFTRNGYISIFTCPSRAKGGKISTIVPQVSHTDHNEHSVQVVVTENGVADLRCKTPHERARLIVDHCAHADFREALHQYFDRVTGGQTPATLAAAYAMHEHFLKTGSMHGVDWTAAGL